jgi:hypothetical protein
MILATVWPAGHLDETSLPALASRTARYCELGVGYHRRASSSGTSQPIVYVLPLCRDQPGTPHWTEAESLFEAVSA